MATRVHYHPIYRIYENVNTDAEKAKQLPISMFIEYCNLERMKKIVRMQIFLIWDLINDIEGGAGDGNEKFKLWKITNKEFNDYIAQDWKRMNESLSNEKSNLDVNVKFLFEQVTKILGLLSSSKKSLVDNVCSFNKLYRMIIHQYNDCGGEGGGSSNSLKMREIIIKMMHANSLEDISEANLIILMQFVQRFIHSIRKPYPMYAMILLFFSHVSMLAEGSINVQIRNKKNPSDCSIKDDGIITIKDVLCNMFISEYKEALKNATGGEFIEMLILDKIPEVADSTSGDFSAKEWFKYLANIDREYVPNVQRKLKRLSDAMENEKYDNRVVGMTNSCERLYDVINYNIITNSNLRRTISRQFNINETNNMYYCFFMNTLVSTIVKNEQVILCEYLALGMKLLRQLKHQYSGVKINININELYVFIRELNEKIKASSCCNYFNLQDIISFCTTSSISKNLLHVMHQVGVNNHSDNV